MSDRLNELVRAEAAARNPHGWVHEDRPALQTLRNLRHHAAWCDGEQRPYEVRYRERPNSSGFDLTALIAWFDRRCVEAAVDPRHKTKRPALLQGMVETIHRTDAEAGDLLRQIIDKFEARL